MSAIIRYILDMLPFILTVLPVYILIRLFTLRKGSFNPRREAALLIFVLFLVGLASQTLIPKIRFTDGVLRVINDGVHTTNLIPFKVFVDTYKEVASGSTHALIINFLGNIVMFMPIGFFVPLLWDVSPVRVILVGFLSSLFIELSQLLLPRSSDVDDLILNTAGVALGLLLFKLIEHFCSAAISKFRKTKNPTE